MRQAVAAAAMSWAALRRRCWDGPLGLTLPSARNDTTICRTEARPSRPPWKAATKITLGGQGQAGRVTASASGMTASQGMPLSLLTDAKYVAPTWLTESISSLAPELPYGDIPPTRLVSVISAAPGT